MSEQATIRKHLEASNEALERIACHPEDALYVAACALDAQAHVIAAIALLNDATQFYCDHLSQAPYLVVIRDDVTPGAGSSLPGAPTNEETT